MKQITWSQIFFGIFAGSIFAAKGLGLYDGQGIFKLVLILAGVCWAGKVVLTDYSKRDIIISILALGAGLISYKVSGDKGLLLYIMLLIGAREIPTDKIMHGALVIWGITFWGLFFATALHVVDSPFKVHEKMGELIIRWGLGYSHPNVLHVSYLVFCLLLGYYLAERFNVKWLLFMLAGNIFVFMYSVSFTGFIAVVFYLILETYFVIFRKDIGKIESILVKVCAAGCMLFSLIAPVVLKGKAFDLVNKIMNTRFNLSKIYLERYPVSILGHRIADITTSSSTMDCSYVYAYVAYGSIIFICLVIVYAISLHRCCQEKSLKKITVMLTCLLAGITEPFLFNASFKNVSVLFLKDNGVNHDKQKILWRGSRLDRECPFLKNRRNSSEKKTWIRILSYKKVMIISFFIACIAVMLFTQGTLKNVERIIVPRSESDLDETFYAERDLNESDLTAEDIIYGISKEGTCWMYLEGKAIQLENIRYMLASGVAAGIFVVIIEGIYFGCKKRA